MISLASRVKNLVALMENQSEELAMMKNLSMIQEDKAKQIKEMNVY